MDGELHVFDLGGVGRWARDRGRYGWTLAMPAVVPGVGEQGAKSFWLGDFA